MRLLVLGGSGFVGHALIESAVARGCRVSAFNNDTRWNSRPDVEHILGNRMTPSGLTGLRGRDWDLVVDTWSGPSPAVNRSVSGLARSAGFYVYISSLTVYQPQPGPLAEIGPIIEERPGDGPETYAVRKLAAELAVAEAFPNNHLIVRAGLLLGPREIPGRLPWWLDRMRRGGDVIAPAPRQRIIQYADARDLADWLVRSSGQHHGVFNFACPPGHATMGGLIESCRTATGEAARVRWVDQGELLRQGVRPWTGLPIWLPAGHDELDLDVYHVDVSRALRAGARFRSLDETVQDTEAWLSQLVAGSEAIPESRPGRLTPLQEETILAGLR